MIATFAPRARLGPYELLVSLASGGMSSVILARQRGAAGFERIVVVKRVHRRHLDNAEFTHMFRDEARLASSIRHPNVASVIDVIEERGELCLVMEYFESLSLGHLVEAAAQREQRLSAAAASRIVSDMLAGLHAAHEAVDIRRNRLGIVHRDVSPQNVIVDCFGVSRVIDFGIAKAESRITHTKSGFVKGKLGYMSPEQIEALPVDRRSDLFSAGVVLHEVLTGKRLFTGDDEFDTMRRVLRGDIPDPSKEVPELGPAVDDILRKALARSPNDRYATALAFKEDLERAIPPVSAQDVGGLVSELGEAELKETADKLLELLGEELEKLSPRSPARSHDTIRTLIDHARRGLVDAPATEQSDPSGTKGNTLPLLTKRSPSALVGDRSIDPHGPTLREVVGVPAGVGPTLNSGATSTLRSTEESAIDDSVEDPIGPPPVARSPLVPILATFFSAAVLAAIVAFLATRPDSSSAPLTPVVSASPTASAPPEPTPSAPLPALVDASTSVATPTSASSPPVKTMAAPSVSSARPKPVPVKPQLQPNPYDDSK
jgi:serine/threonine protein kinase